MENYEIDKLKIKREALLAKKRLVDAIDLLREKGPRGKNIFRTSCYYLTRATKIHDWDNFKNLLDSFQEEEIAKFDIDEYATIRWGDVAIKIEIFNTFENYAKKIREEYHVINDLLNGENTVSKKPGELFIAARNIKNQGSIESRGQNASTVIITENYAGSGKIVNSIASPSNKKLAKEKVIVKTPSWKKPEVIIPIIIALISIPWWPTFFGYFLKNNVNIPNKAGEINIYAVENPIDPNTKKLDRSIFDLAKETVATGLTSQERVNLISNIFGLVTKEEVGKIEDIGVDGLSLLIIGNSADGYGGSVIRCDFSLSWKQRISLLKKDSEIKFIGVVSKYDLSKQKMFESRI